MPKIEIDVEQLARAIADLVPPPVSEAQLRAIGASARARWIGFAQDELSSSSRDYIQGIGQPATRPGAVAITLGGTLPNMVEQGWPATDLRRTVLQGKARVSKKGYRYQAVPFRHGSPGTGGRNVGAPMPRPIHAAARALMPARAPVPPEFRRLTPGAPNLGRQVRRMLDQKMREWHSTSIYTGMQRETVTFASGKTGSKFTTFRTISENPKHDPRSWLHPGIQARHLARKVEQHVTEIVHDVLAGGRR